MDGEQLGLEFESVEIKDAAQLWRFLNTGAGLDLKYYDKQMLDSEDPDLNLYSLLGIKCDLPSVEENLKAAGVTLEHMLVNLLTAFHPYSMMINEICRFFDKYEIKYADQNIRMEFDFGSVTEDMRFDLENFREIARNYHLIESQSFAYEIRLLQLNDLDDIFPHNGSVTILNEAANSWIDSYISDGEDAVFTAPDIETPVTGHPDIDRNLEIILNIWRSFVNQCIVNGGTLKALEQAANWPEDRVSIESDENVINDVRLLCQASLDHWAKNFLIRFFGKIEEIEALEDQERIKSFNVLSDQLQKFVASLKRVSVTGSQEMLTEQLKDILNLPVWKFRYELYAAWLLTKIDQAFDRYEVMLHHTNGKLSLPFKATRIATVESMEGDFELWSEVRSPLENPTGGKRNSAIQPDYRIFFSTDEQTPENHFAVVEVKQYKTYHKTNFTQAMDDYAAGLPTAKIFLVNYGPVKDSMDLKFPERCTYMGQIRPDESGAEDFVRNLEEILPAAEQDGIINYLDSLQLELYFGCPIDEIYVDISESLNHPEYKLFLKEVLKGVMKRHDIAKLSAVDCIERHRWPSPDENALEELTALDYWSSTYFEEIISGVNGRKLIVTDCDGYNMCVKNNCLIGGCLIFERGQVTFKTLGQDMW